MRRDILTKRAEKIVEQARSEAIGSRIVAASARNIGSCGSSRSAAADTTICHARVQPILPIIQQPQPFFGGPPALVGEIVRHAGKRVQRRDVGPHLRRDEPRSDGKVLVMRARQPLAFGICRAQPRVIDLGRHQQGRYCTGESGDERCATS